MTDPTTRSGRPPTNEATLRAVQADRARVEAARTAARRSRRSPGAVAGTLRRWLRDRRSGPIGRLRMAVGVVRGSVRSGGPWAGLPAAVLRTLLRPTGVAAPPRILPGRDLDADRAAAAVRVRAAAALFAGRDRATVTVGAVAGPSDLAALAADGPVAVLRPEDWAVTVTAARPDVIVVVGSPGTDTGAWAHRLAWTIHPDRLLARDLDALAAWAAGAAVPSVFVLDPGSVERLEDWRGAADRLDLTVAPDVASVAELSAGPDRRGAGAVVGTAVGVLAAIAAAAGSDR